MATKKAKAAAASNVPQSKDDCASSIRSLGDLMRQYERERAALNDAIAALAQQAQPVLEQLQSQIEALRAGIQTWCEANRVQLCGEDDRLGKTADLVTGEVSWRMRPPSVTVRGAEAVVDILKARNLQRFVRTKEEVNKEAILAEPGAVRGVPGIQVVTGLEDFSVVPFELEANLAGAAS